MVKPIVAYAFPVWVNKNAATKCIRQDAEAYVFSHWCLETMRSTFFPFDDNRRNKNWTSSIFFWE